MHAFTIWLLGFNIAFLILGSEASEKYYKIMREYMKDIGSHHQKREHDLGSQRHSAAEELKYRALLYPRVFLPVNVVGDSEKPIQMDPQELDESVNASAMDESMQDTSDPDKVVPSKAEEAAVAHTDKFFFSCHDPEERHGFQKKLKVEALKLMNKYAVYFLRELSKIMDDMLEDYDKIYFKSNEFHRPRL